MKKTDFTQGNISKSIFSYCIPLVIGSTIQVFFNMADQIVLGRMAGGVALASVGACSNVVGIVVNFFVGLSGGVGVILARAIGMRDDERSKKIIGTAFISSILIGVIALSIGLPTAMPLLRITKCPAECIDGALTYTRIYYLGIPLITVYNFCAACLRTSGDSKRPTIYMIIAGAVNLGLNVLLCFILKNKIAAVAIATDVSQAIGAVLTVVRLVKMDEYYRLNIKRPKFDKEILGKILRFGVPNGFCNCLYGIANLQLQAGINSYGTDAIAGHSVAASIDSLVTPVVGGFGTTVSTMVGQNLGAEKPDRVKKSIAYTLLYSVVISEFLCLIVYFFRIPLLHLYMPDTPGAIEYAVIRMQSVLLWFGVHATFSTLSSTLTAYGYAVFVMVSNFLTTVVFRTFWMQLVYPRFESFRTIMVCYTVAWILSAILDAAAFAIVYRRYKKGKLRKI